MLGNDAGRSAQEFEAGAHGDRRRGNGLSFAAEMSPALLTRVRTCEDTQGRASRSSIGRTLKEVAGLGRCNTLVR